MKTPFRGLPKFARLTRTESAGRTHRTPEAGNRGAFARCIKENVSGARRFLSPGRGGFERLDGEVKARKPKLVLNTTTGEYSLLHAGNATLGQLLKLGRKLERTHSPAAIFSFYSAAAIEREVNSPEDGLQLMEKSVAALSLALKTGWNPAGPVEAARGWLTAMEPQNEEDSALRQRLMNTLDTCTAQQGECANWSAFHRCATAFAGSRQLAPLGDRVEMLEQANMSLHAGVEVSMDGFKALIVLNQQSLQDLKGGWFGSSGTETFERAHAQIKWLENLVNQVGPRIRAHGRANCRPGGAVESTG